MIDIYTEKKDSKDWIIQNNLFFNLFVCFIYQSNNNKTFIYKIMVSHLILVFFLFLFVKFFYLLTQNNNL